MNEDTDEKTDDQSAESDKPAAPVRQQRAKRYRVHLALRYRTGKEMVPAFADNMSRGGLYVVGAQNLAPGTITDVEISLPGSPSFTVRAEVRHVMPDELARRFKRKPGAGMMFKESPAGFDSCLASYLFRLARREEVAVLVTDDGSYHLLRAAGYVTERAPKADSVNDAVSASMQPIIGVVVRSAEAPSYRDALAEQDAQDLVVELENVNELDEALNVLDKRLSEEAPLEGATVDPSLGEMEDVPGPPPTTKKRKAEARAVDRTVDPAANSSASHPRLPKVSPPKSGGASYTFVAILVLLAACIGFAAGFLLYFDRPTTGYARRSSRSTCVKCKPCPPPMAPSTPRTPPPVPTP